LSGTIRLGTRGSALALAQSRLVASALAQARPGLSVALSVIKTEGDVNAGASLTGSGGKGLFTKEIEDALLAGTIDLAVHSLKDLPTTVPDGLTVAAIPERADPRDVLVAGEARTIEDLPARARVGTGSPRRSCQLLARRPDLVITPVRGNVDTRVRKLLRGEFDALVLAAAGLDRLGLEVPGRAPIPPGICLPAPGQGALALETRAEDTATRRLVEALHDPAAASCTTAERSYLAALGVGCLAPAAALARIEAGRLVLDALLADPDGTNLRRARIEGGPGEAEALGRALAERLA